MDPRQSGSGRKHIGIIWAASLVATAVIAFLGSSWINGGLTGNSGSQAVREQLLVSEMRLNLARAAEKEKCAVLSASDEEAGNYADESRAASAAVDRDLGKLRKLVADRGSDRDRELLGKFESSWKNLKQIDTNLLVSAPQNTSVKAIDLECTIGAELLQKFHDNLGKAVLKGNPPSRKIEMEKVAAQAETAMQNIALLQMRHLHAPSAAEKHTLESSMNDSRKRAEASLKSFELLNGKKGNPFLKGATTVFGEFMQVNEEVVRLSHIDSNVAAAGLSLGKKRIIDAECDRELKALVAPGFGGLNQ